MIQVNVAGLSVSKVGFVLLLRGSQDKRTLPIFIGAAEAQSIAIQLSKTAVPRPMTHDLFKDLLDCVECRLKRIEIHTLAENTFYARLILEHNAMDFDVDARPSDAVALALRCASPIFVAQSVMDQAGLILDDKANGARAKPNGQAEKPALTPLEELKRKLEQAVTEERYEDAAKVRDEIQRLEHPQSHN